MGRRINLCRALIEAPEKKCGDSGECGGDDDDANEKLGRCQRGAAEKTDQMKRETNEKVERVMAKAEGVVLGRAR